MAASHSPPEQLPIGPIIAVLIGAVASLCLSCVVIVLVVRARRGAARPKRNLSGGSEPDKADTHSITNQTEHSVATYIDAEEQSPDVIPYRNSEDISEDI